MKIYTIAQNSLVVYHGSFSKEIIFDPRKQESGYYPGFYTTTNESLAKTYGAWIHQFSLDDSRFFDIESNIVADQVKQAARKAGFNTNAGSGHGDVEYLKSLGYEGIRRGIEYIVFNPKKSLKFIKVTQSDDQTAL
jgi:hypothetical protein